MRSLLSISFLLFVLPSILVAQRDAKIPDPDPEIERKTFILPEGFEVNLWAADPLLAKPIQMNWDPQGRLWVASSEVYPQIAPGQTANDKIVILEDTKGTGSADKVTVFADGLLIPTGVAPDAKGGCYVAASTELLHFSASKPGEKADTKRIVLSGFGTEDTHHILHTLRWGPDGKLYMNQSVYIHSHVETPFGVRRLNGGGIWQYDTQTGRLEVFARGFWNPWGTAFDRYGQMFETDGANGEGIVHVIPGASYPTGNHAAPRVLHGLNPGSPKHCGLEILSGRQLPDDYQGDMITNDFRGHRVCRFKVSESGSTFVSREMPELIKSNHPAFRPIDVKMGPDGAIYIADWYNPIIQHGEVDFRDPRRDHTHGRIWRITAKGRPLVKKPDFAKMTVPQLVEDLQSPEGWTRDMARRSLRPLIDSPEFQRETIKILGLGSKADPELKLEMARLSSPSLLDFVGNLKSKYPQLSSAFVRLYSQFSPEIDDPKASPWLEFGIGHPSPAVRLEAIRGCARWRRPESVELALQALDHPMDPTLDYALYLTVRELEPIWLPAFYEGKLTFNNNPAHIAFALQAVNNSGTLPELKKLIASSKFPPDQSLALWKLLADIGGAEEHAMLFTKAVSKEATPELKSQLLKILVEDKKRLKPKISDEQLASLLEPNAKADVESALRLVGRWKHDGLLPLLDSWGKKTKDDAVRIAAFQGMADLQSPASLKILRDYASGGTNEEITAEALLALIPHDEKFAAAHVPQLLQKALPPNRVLAIFAAFLDRKTGPANLAEAFKKAKIAPDMAKLGIRAVRSSGKDFPALIAALNTAGGLATLKPDYSPEAVKRMVAEATTKGDAARGEALYRRKELQCLNCHAIGGVGSPVGPDMTSIGASAQMDYLIESLWLPSKAIKEGYHSLLINTEDGKSISGIPVREANGELILRTADDKQITIPLKDIADRKEGKSLMPEGLMDALTWSEQADLVKFLSELGKVGPYAPLRKSVARRWQTIEVNPATLSYIRSKRLADVSSKDSPATWVPIYAEVAGKLPLSDLPAFPVWSGSDPQSILRTQIEASTPGKAVVRFGDAKGLQIWLNGKAIDTKEGAELELAKGANELLLIVNRKLRQEPIFLELEEAKKDSAKFAFVLGK